MTTFKTKRYSFEAVRFDGTNQLEIKEFGGDNVQIFPNGKVFVMTDHTLYNMYNSEEIEPLYDGDYLCKDEDGYFTISDNVVDNNRLIEPAIKFNVEE